MNHVERRALECGFTVERFLHDYGVDLLLVTYDPDGEVEPGFVGFQVKATERPDLSADGSFVSVRVESADLGLWLFASMPIILVVYDAAADRAFWVDVQRYAVSPGIALDEVGETVTIRVPTGNRLDLPAVHGFRATKAEHQSRRAGPFGGSA